MPETMPTPCMDALRQPCTGRAKNYSKWLMRKNLAQPVSIPLSTSKLLIFFVFLVRDQEAGGSNPLAPTKFDIATSQPLLVGMLFTPVGNPALPFSYLRLCQPQTKSGATVYGTPLGSESEHTELRGYGAGSRPSRVRCCRR